MGQQKKTRKVGRPKLPKGEAKGRIVPVRFTHRDMKIIEAAAKANKQTISQWVRSAVMGRNIEVWYGYCSDDHIAVAELDSPPHAGTSYCGRCGVSKKLTGIKKGYVSHEERNQRYAVSEPLSNPDSTPPPDRL